MLIIVYSNEKPNHFSDIVSATQYNSDVIPAHVACNILI